MDYVKENCKVNSIFLYPRCKTELKTIINEQSARKAPGYDFITPSIVKSIADNILKQLVDLVNFSLSSGKFPTDLKHVIVVPLHKKSDRKNPATFGLSAYRVAFDIF